MNFKERFVTAYRYALTGARKGDFEGVRDGFSNIYELLSKQYELNNGDPIQMKAQLKYWKEAFGKYILILNRYGLYDARIQKLFGLTNEFDAPTFDDVLKGKAELDVKDSAPLVNQDFEDRINIEDILPEPVKNETGYVEVQSQDYLLEPKSLKDFIGQEQIRKQLLKEIAIAKNEGRRHLDNILLFGNPGLGKTTLMKLLAKELGVRFAILDCSQFSNRKAEDLKKLQNFLMNISEMNEPVVIALDEIHMLSPALQSSLLTLLNDHVYVTPLDNNGESQRIPIGEFTFIAATTDDDKVLDTIKDRCLRLKFQMTDYTDDELRQIYRNKIMAMKLTVTDEALDICLPRSRGSIRYINSFVKGLDIALYDEDGNRKSAHIDKEVALKFFAEQGIDELGLTKKDREILMAIKNDKSNVVSADVLAARVGLDTKKYRSEFERYLIKIGLIEVTEKGRVLTDKALKYLDNL